VQGSGCRVLGARCEVLDSGGGSGSSGEDGFSQGRGFLCCGLASWDLNRPPKSHRIREAMVRADATLGRRAVPLVACSGPGYPLPPITADYRRRSAAHAAAGWFRRMPERPAVRTADFHVRLHGRWLSTSRPIDQSPYRPFDCGWRMADADGRGRIARWPGRGPGAGAVPLKGEADDERGGEGLVLDGRACWLGTGKSRVMTHQS
jgi:hypothetical protein